MVNHSVRYDRLTQAKNAGLCSILLTNLNFDPITGKRSINRNLSLFSREV